MLPGRHQLAKQHEVALTTLERAVTTLISEGVLRAEDGHGTFVAALTPASAATVTHAAPPPAVAPRDRKPLVAKVGIIAKIVPYDSPEMRAGQWAAQILAACEQGLSGERGLTQRFVSLVPEMKKDITCTQAAKQLLDDSVDALVVIGCGDLEATLALAEAAGVPLVCAEYDLVAAPVPQVYVDNEAGGVLAARHLRERGYRPLVYLMPFRSVWAESRLAGVRSVVGADALRVFPVDSVLPLAESDTWFIQQAAGLQAGRALLKAGFEAGSGVIAPNDAVAMGFIEAARERGLEPGRDYGIVGFDDRCREAHLTSLRQPLAQLGREAAELVVHLLRGEEAPARVTLRHQLIARESTAAWGKRVEG
jgi:DNA-binding LacI/PurR family transcriptional regulator